MLQYGQTGSFSARMEGPFGSTGVTNKLTYISIPASGWKGGESPFHQVVNVEEISNNSMVVLQPSVEQLNAWREMDLAFTTENDEGIVTVYAIGDRPTEDITIQATIMEVVA